ncbi:MAG: carbamate kinase [Chlorobiaceae bacterium]|nr:carbamate kinase [Chlorobiaceae bacterium]
MKRKIDCIHKKLLCSHCLRGHSLKNSVLIAIGGNSLIRAGQKGTIPEQFANANITAQSVSDLAKRGYRLVVTHGNGPQVGAQLLRSEAGSHQTYTMPLDVCVAMTQGEIGYILQTSLQSILKSKNLQTSVAGLVTQVVVDKNDPAFLKPTKPIGPFYSREVAQQKKEELGWNIVEDAARGYRRVVPSPKPLDIVELDIIKECLERGIIVIAAGGGGIPVCFENGSIIGIEAVIDKDRASALLASRLGIERFIISTEVEQVYINFKKPNQKPLNSISLDEMKKYLEEGHFLEGSMKPKIEAAINFLEEGGMEVIITDPEHIVEAFDGKTGTRIKGRRL